MTAFPYFKFSTSQAQCHMGRGCHLGSRGAAASAHSPLVDKGLAGAAEAARGGHAVWTFRCLPRRPQAASGKCTVVRATSDYQALRRGVPRGRPQRARGRGARGGSARRRPEAGTERDSRQAGVAVPASLWPAAGRPAGGTSRAQRTEVSLGAQPRAAPRLGAGRGCASSAESPCCCCGWPQVTEKDTSLRLEGRGPRSPGAGGAWGAVASRDEAAGQVASDSEGRLRLNSA